MGSHASAAFSTMQAICGLFTNVDLLTITSSCVLSQNSEAFIMVIKCRNHLSKVENLHNIYQKKILGGFFWWGGGVGAGERVIRPLNYNF